MSLDSIQMDVELYVGGEKDEGRTVSKLTDFATLMDDVVGGDQWDSGALEIHIYAARNKETGKAEIKAVNVLAVEDSPTPLS